MNKQINDKRFANIRKLQNNRYQVTIGSEADIKYQFGYFLELSDAIEARNKLYKKKRRYHSSIMFAEKKFPKLTFIQMFSGSKKREKETIIATSFYRIDDHTRNNKLFLLSHYNSKDGCMKAAVKWEKQYRKKFNQVVRIANKMICESAKEVAALELETLKPQFYLLHNNKMSFWLAAYDKWSKNSENI